MSVTMLMQAVGSAPTTGASTLIPKHSINGAQVTGYTFHAIQTGSGTQTATLLIEVSNDGTNFITLGTITLNATTPAQDGFASNARWEYVRGRLTAQTGTGAALNLFMGW